MQHKATHILPDTSDSANPQDVGPPRTGPHQIWVGPVGLPQPRPQPRPQPTPKPRASNEARAWLAVADVTPTGHRIGVFLANHARYATDGDRRRKVKAGDIFCYWPQAKIAADLGCSVRQVKRGVRSLRAAGVITVRQRVRPYGASYVWARPVPSGVPSGVPSHREPRTEPRIEPRTANTAAAGVLPAVPKGEQQSKGQQQQQRINGMLASCEISARVLQVDFDTADHRQRLLDGTLPLAAMQAFTDDLKAQRAVRTRRYMGGRGDANLH